MKPKEPLPQRRGLLPLTQHEKARYEEEEGLPTPALKHASGSDDAILEIEWLSNQDEPHIYAKIRSPEGNVHAYHFNRQVVHAEQGPRNRTPFLQVRPFGSTNPSREEIRHAIRAVSKAFQEAKQNAPKWPTDVNAEELAAVAKAMKNLERVHAQRPK
ncbi:hypothetical protein HY572_05665 [Candidatus Micrarchaeota archaeon]|nr:hypothetical protein [Candidatus Micrarchaeota archaeon]